MKKIPVIILGALLISSCATQKNVNLSDEYWQQKQHKVAVITTKAPKPGLAKVGSQGLLDYAVNSAMTNKLDNQMSKTDLTWYDNMPSELSARLKANKVDAVVAGNNLSTDNKYLRNLVARNGADEVLVLELRASGAVRSYSSVIPTGDPKAYCVLQGELIDPNTKAVKWRHLAEIELPIKGAWDQPPAYPNVVASVNDAVKLCKQEVMDSFFSGRA